MERLYFSNYCHNVCGKNYCVWEDTTSKKMFKEFTESINLMTSKNGIKMFVFPHCVMKVLKQKNILKAFFTKH